MADANLSAETLRRYFSYNEDTGHLIRNGEQLQSGRIATKGYRQVFINGRRYMAHRLAWMYVYGAWPDKQIDHINRDKDDNRISNLREVDNKQNQENVGLRTDNRSGYRGVSVSRNGTFRADIKLDGKTVHLGSFKTTEEAALARMKAESANFSILDYSPIYADDAKLLNLLEVRDRLRAP